LDVGELLPVGEPEASGLPRGADRLPVPPLVLTDRGVASGTAGPSHVRTEQSHEFNRTYQGRFTVNQDHLWEWILHLHLWPGRASDKTEAEATFQKTATRRASPGWPAFCP